MQLLRAFYAGLKALRNKEQRRDEIHEELNSFLEASMAEKMQRGLSKEAALRAARAEIGSRESVRQQVQSSGWEHWVETLWQDVRYGLRQIVRYPSFSLIAIVTLALGIGANTAIFTLVHAVMLKQLPISNPKELYRVGDGETYCCAWTGLQDNWGTFDYPFYKHLRDTNKSFKQLAAFSGGIRSVNIRKAQTSEVAQTYNGEFVSGNYFATLGINASHGRLLSPSDDSLSASPAVVLSYRAWQEHYHGDTSVIGSTVFVDNVAMTVVGIGPEGFSGDRLTENPPELWIPLEQMPLFNRSGQKSVLSQEGLAWIFIIGRLEPGVSPGDVQKQVSGELQQWLRSVKTLDQEGLAKLPKQEVRLTPGGTGISPFRSNSKTGLYLLSGVSVLVLLIACGNLANLFLARGAAREQQTALRLSLGATRGRLIRAVLTESVLLSLFGCLGGLALAYAGTKAILLIVFRGASFIPVNASPSLPVLGFSILLSLATGVLFGVLPAWIGSRMRPTDGLRESSRTTTSRSSKSQQVLIASQIALSIILLTVAGFVTQSLRNLEKTKLGFETHGRLIANLNFAATGYKPEAMPALYKKVQERLEALPGVRSAGLAINTPQNLCCYNIGISISGRPEKWIEDVNTLLFRVSPHYFDSLGTPLLKGRALADTDTQTSPLVAIVDESFARKFFPGEEALGKHFGLQIQGHGSDFEIVGIVADSRYKTPTAKQSPAFFLPFTQTVSYDEEGMKRLESGSFYAQSIVLHVDGQSSNYENVLRTTLADIDPNLSIYKILTYDEQIAVQFNQERLVARLTELFSILALLLASIGLYGVTAYNVNRRTSEIGVRMALGATRGSVMRLVLKNAFLKVGVGAAIGMPISILCGQALAHLLYNVGRFDLTILSIAIFTLTSCTFVASLIPARRASAIEPMQALRNE